MLPSHPPTPPTEFAISPAVLLRALRKNWLLACALLGLCIAGSAAYTATQKRIYEAVATVQLDPQPLMPLGHRGSGNESGPESYWTNAEYFATQHQVLTSRKVATLVVRRLGLDKDSAFLQNEAAPRGERQAPVSVEQAAEALRARLTVKPVKESRLALVSLQDADPKRAQRVLAAIVDVYVEQNLDTTLDSANKTAEWLDTQLGKLRTELESQEMDLHDFKKRNNLLSVSFDDQSNMLRAQIQQLNATLTDLKTKRENVASRLAVLQGIDPEDPAVIPRSELFGNETLGPMRERYMLAKKELSRLAAMGKGDNYPEVQATRADLEATRAALLSELRNVREGVSRDLAAVQGELQGVSNLYEAAKSHALELNINELRFTRLRRSKDSTERVFGMVLERSTESGLSKVMPFNNVRVLDRPLTPTVPILPRPLANLALGGALGLLLGLVGAIGREALDRTVRNAEEVERELGLPSLGSLPDALAKHSGGSIYGPYYGRSNSERKKARQAETTASAGPPELLVHTHPKSQGSEAARAIRTNLLFMSPDRPFHTLLVTSAGPAEGKTTVAVSIAIAMAQSGRKVCLVDCDMRRPRVHSLFDTPLQRGVTTALLDTSKLDEALTDTGVPNLSILPAGPTPPNPADLIHSEAFTRLLESLKGRFDQVVLDSPPVCVVTDAAVAATRVDACVLVIRARRTRRDAARRALRVLQDVGANCTGFVLNAVVPTGEGYSYSYYRADDTETGSA